MTQTPAGWQPDPHDPSQLRYWDGTHWTDHRAPAQPPSHAAPPVGPATGSVPVTAPTAGTTRTAPPASSGSKRNVWIALGAVVLLVGGCSIGAAAAGGSDDGDKETATATATVTVTKEAKASATAPDATATVTVTAEAAPADNSADDTPAADSADDEPATDDGTKPSLTLPKQNGDWRLDTLQLKDDGLGDFAGVGRITYTGGDDSGGDNIFTVTIFAKDGETILGTLDGSASGVKPGQTVTVDFFGFDPYKTGKFPFTFQNNL